VFGPQLHDFETSKYMMLRKRRIYALLQFATAMIDVGLTFRANAVCC